VPDPAPAPAPLKPGYLTSEAWLSFLTIVVGAIPTSGLVADAPMVAKIVGLVIAALSAINYTIQRTALKRAQLAALAGAPPRGGSRLPTLVTGALLVLATTLGISCSGTACQDPKNAQSAQCVIEGAVVDCTGVSSLTTAVTVVEPIVEQLILSAVQADGTVGWALIEPQIVALALQYGGCVIAEIWDYYVHGTPIPGIGSGGGSGSGSASGSAAAIPAPFLARVKISPSEFSAEFERLRARIAPGQKFKLLSGTTL